MNFSFAHIIKIGFKITSCASGDTGFEKTNNEYHSGFEPNWICVVLIVTKMFLLWTFNSSFDYHALTY
jgi:hypothetical protein